MRVELRAEARSDLVDGAWFYERQAQGLGAYFLECLRDDIRVLESASGIHEKYLGLYRKLSKRFPFAIYDLLTDHIADVVAILDCRSNPESIDARLEQADT